MQTDSLGLPLSLMYSCRHERKAIRVKTIANGRTQVRNQCLDCGAAVGPVLPAVRGVGAPRFDEALFAKTMEARESYYAEMRQQREQQKEEWSRWYYEEYLLSPGWKRRRDLVMVRCGGICEGCRSAKATQVHHTKAAYDQLRSIGREMLFDLHALCDGCHELLHRRAEVDQ